MQKDAEAAEKLVTGSSREQGYICTGNSAGGRRKQGKAIAYGVHAFSPEFHICVASIVQFFLLLPFLP